MVSHDTREARGGTVSTATYSIADYIADGNPLHLYDGSMFKSPDDEAAFVKDAERVRADEPAQWYFLDESVDDWSLGGKQYGPLRLPYPAMWVEWSAPQEYRAEGRTARNPNSSYALACREVDKEELLAELARLAPVAEARRNLMWASRVVHCHVYAMSRQTGLVYVMGTVLIGTDDLGAYKGMFRMTYGRYAPEDNAILGQSLAEASRPGLIAVGLMNCRNVEISHPMSPRLRKTGPRVKRMPRLSFRTIRLPLPASASTASKAEVAQNAMPFHMVRGHFKTYTEDAPLMGRFTGTYWWGAQARGSKANGIVKKDYAVGAGPNPYR